MSRSKTGYDLDQLIQYEPLVEEFLSALRKDPSYAVSIFKTAHFVMKRRLRHSNNATDVIKKVTDDLSDSSGNPRSTSS